MSEEDPWESLCGFSIEALAVDTFDGYPQSLLDPPASVLDPSSGKVEVVMVPNEGGVMDPIELTIDDRTVGTIDGNIVDLHYLSLIRLQGYPIVTQGTIEVPADAPQSPRLSVYLPTHAEIEKQAIAAIARGDAW